MVEIRYAREEDCPRIGAVNAAAYATGLFLANAFPQATPDERAEYMHFRAMQTLLDPSVCTLVAIEVETNTIVAVAQWRGIFSEERQSIVLSDEGTAFVKREFSLEPRNQDVINAFRALVQAKRERYLGDEIVLDQLCTHPQYQGRGIGATMLQWGINKADEMQKDIYLEATAAARSLYSRLGWEMLEKAVLDYGLYGGEGVDKVYFMRRPHTR
ncbi:hypothetical protein ASPZODRAFT_77439 [Penicilliopsis zonata CBS 506.65]|uniref:N-acetyltransferase domain-containing protein n=1 Tax=Penicilliopsis zonata CBS 506.65 TaxID=1073090 RepID=A0A1L9S4Y0_9EURO|nr:hypothetical protein ASPZODRAFT_77439 [Penicilliopsis zonata CBS 506.65]OJJ42212.1 hypothetical protein ASPZODRAFT_77439 [Penicilliopsis zonata CBS 506.65]